jgi:His/Glu/Gln/Arg/opine family amino acid ABC transporter permease subunit
MSEHRDSGLFYIAPPEAPPSRRPPLTVTGPLGWLRENLFSSWINSIATVVMGVLLIAFIWTFLSWAMRDAQWAVVYNNLRLLSVGSYDKNEVWRMEFVTGMLVFLTGLGLGIWGRVARSVFFAVLVTLAIILVIPIIGAQIPEPLAYVLMQPGQDPADFVFLGLKGQEVSFEIDPLTDPADAEASQIGYVEADSRVTWSTQARQARDGNLDLSEYTLGITLRLTDERGDVLERTITETDAEGNETTTSIPAILNLTPEDRAGTLSFTLPADDWYILEIVYNDEAANDAGYAWLKIDGVELYSMQEEDVESRQNEYGVPPKPESALYAGERFFTYVGARDFGEFISLQVSPLFSRIALPFVAGAVLFFDGWLIGLLGKRERSIRRSTIIGWALAFPVAIIVLRGFEDSRALPLVSSSVWGGLLLTVLLTFVGITASFPLGVTLALGRRSDLPVIKWTCTMFIETVRGVPLITILFMAKLIVPFFWSALSDIDLTVRMMIGLTLFSAAYLAENVRGGLQIIPYGQLEASRALGLNPFLTMTFIVLPQALRAVIPAIVGQFISLFKDTSLVALVGLFELVGIVDTIVSGQTLYRPYQREAYIFIAIVYFMISFAMSDVSRRLEATGAGSIRRQ